MPARKKPFKLIEMKNILLRRKPLLKIIIAVFAIAMLPSCATYHTKTAALETNLFDGNFSQAIANIDNNKFLQKERNKLLYLMEKGKVENLKGNYEKK